MKDQKEIVKYGFGSADEHRDNEKRKCERKWNIESSTVEKSAEAIEMPSIRVFAHTHIKKKRTKVMAMNEQAG